MKSHLLPKIGTKKVAFLLLEIKISAIFDGHFLVIL